MQFRLPSNLQTELVAYDPTLKKLKQQTKASSTKKPKYPLGNPKDIIPADIVKPEELQKAIDHINSQIVENRHVKFDKFVKDPDYPDQTRLQLYAILYHYESCWYAAWLPPKGKEDEYIYGLTFAYKDTAASKPVPHKVKELTTRYGELKHYGRVTMKSVTKLITKDDVFKGSPWNIQGWNMPYIQYGKGCNIRTQVQSFYNVLKQSIPSWEDSRNIFERIECKSIADILFDAYPYKQPQDSYWETVDKSQWKIDVNSLLGFISTEWSNHYSFNCYKHILHIIDKPFFRKWIQSKLDECNNLFADKSNTFKRLILAPYKQVIFLFDQISRINTIWPDTPIDHYQNNMDLLLTVDIPDTCVTLSVCEWLREHMPVTSFFNNLRTYRDNVIQGYGYYEWRDTLEMIDKILGAGKTLEPPRRWRMSEFHDHVQAEAWKIQNPNHGLPQDLFPNPVRIDIDGTKLSFFQPVDTHQLAQWGNAARNCVGSASSYAEGVKKKKHFIVLCMVDGKPKYTVQLSVNNGLMEVKQIAGIANSRLSDEERELYTKAFAAALRKREDELKSA